MLDLLCIGFDSISNSWALYSTMSIGQAVYKKLQSRIFCFKISVSTLYALLYAYMDKKQQTHTHKNRGFLSVLTQVLQPVSWFSFSSSDNISLPENIGLDRNYCQQNVGHKYLIIKTCFSTDWGRWWWKFTSHSVDVEAL